MISRDAIRLVLSGVAAVVTGSSAAVIVWCLWRLLTVEGAWLWSNT